jgi:hypothetical protein
MLRRKSNCWTMLSVGLLLLLAVLWTDFDLDCSAGSMCVKTNGQMYGVCTGGISPGNNNDRNPVYLMLDITRTYGNTCSSNANCGTELVCLKEAGSIRGTCMSMKSIDSSAKRARRESASPSDEDKDSGACKDNSDCGIGFMWLKAEGESAGVCVKR